MDDCFVPCGCEVKKGVTKSDLDRYTDKIENILNDEKGRKFFRNFMYTSKFKVGRRTLDFWEHVERLLTYREDAASGSRTFRNYLNDIDDLIDRAEAIDEIDFATMERLTIARDSENVEQIKEVLKLLKVEATKALSREYNAFRGLYVPKK